jgi:hypothetical protein
LPEYVAVIVWLPTESAVVVQAALPFVSTTAEQPAIDPPPSRKSTLPVGVPLGQTVVFTTTLAGSAGEVTGTVAFRDGSSVIAGCEAVALSGGRAQCATAKLAKGGHSIVAAYSGSAAYNPVTSNPLKQNVKPK